MRAPRSWAQICHLCGAIVVILPPIMARWGSDVDLAIVMEHWRTFHPLLLGIDPEEEHRQKAAAWLWEQHRN